VKRFVGLGSFIVSLIMLPNSALGVVGKPNVGIVSVYARYNVNKVHNAYVLKRKPLTKFG